MSDATPPSRESIYATLFAQLNLATINGNPAFVTTGRQAQSEEQLNAVEKPAMFMLQLSEDWKQNNSGIPYVAEAMVEVYVLVSQPDDLVAPVPQLNDLIDATLRTLAPAYPGAKQTLGGLVDNVVLRGKAEYRMGLKGVINAFAVFPVVLIMPNLEQWGSGPAVSTPLGGSVTRYNFLPAPNGSVVTFTVPVVISANGIVVRNGVIQTSGYTFTGNSVTFSAAPAIGDELALWQ